MQNMCAQIAEIIKSYVKDLDLDKNRYEANLTELGIDSIAFIQIVVEMEDRFQIEIPDEYLLFSEMDTVYKMASVVMSLTEGVEK